jgi:hypothetical protein
MMVGVTASAAAAAGSSSKNSLFRWWELPSFSSSSSSISIRSISISISISSSSSSSSSGGGSSSGGSRDDEGMIQHATILAMIRMTKKLFPISSQFLFSRSHPPVYHVLHVR